MTAPITSSPIVAVLPHRAVLAISGADRHTFLQGLVSNDVDRVTPEQAVWAAFLTPQGKIIHEFMIAEADDTLLLDVEAERLDDLRTRLSRYKLRAKVQIEARPDWVVAAVFAGGEAALGLPAEPGAAKAFGGGVAFADPRLAEAGARVLVPSADALAELGGTQGSVEDWDRQRLRLGLPDGSRDIEPEKGFLLEYGFDELHGIDFKKGCYVGQETTARMKWKHLTKKRLLPVVIDGPLPAPGTPVTTAEGASVGEVRSGLAKDGESLALAVIKLDALEKAPLTAGEATVTVVRPAWLRLPQPAA